jgi:hypothetical protein
MSPISSWVPPSLITTVTSSSVSRHFRFEGNDTEFPANHRTGETCTLTFKPRGWRGANAMEIKGVVADSSGQGVWDIAGRELENMTDSHLEAS